MRIDTTKGELMKLLAVQKALPARHSLDIVTGVYLEAKDGLIARATDLEIGIEARADAEVIAEGAVVVNGVMFCNLVKMLPDVPITVHNLPDPPSGKFDEGLEFSYSDSSQTLPTFDASQYPEFPEIGPDVVEIDTDAMKRVMFACSQDMSKPVFNGVMIDGERAVASDTFRLAIAPLKADIEQMVIPYKLLEKLSGTVLMSRDQNKAVFQVGDLIVFGSLFEGQFPDLSRILPKDFTTEIRFNRPELLGAVERASLYSDYVKFGIADKLTVTAEDAGGKLREEMDIERDGEEVGIVFNAEFIRDGLKHLDTLKLNGRHGAAVMEGEGLHYLVLPIKEG